jgi:adenylate cyclase
MNWAFLNIRLRVEAKYSGLKEGGYTLEHSAGVDIGDVLLVRAGVRGPNDLVSIGAAPNIAARLSDLREAPNRSFITAAVYDRVRSDVKLAGDGRNMWERRTLTVKGKAYTIYRSHFWWSIA